MSQTKVMKYNHLFTGVLLALISINSGCSLAETAPDKPITNNAPITDIKIGVVSQLIKNKEDIPQSFEFLSQSNVNAIREGIPWGQVEISRGQYQFSSRMDSVVNESARLGISPLLILLGPTPTFYAKGRPYEPANVEPYISFAEHVVQKYKGKVSMYEIGNEWNIKDGAKDNTVEGQNKLELYIKLLQKLYPRLKKIDPNIKILGPVMTGNGVDRGALEFMAQNGVMKYLDGISFHSYPHKNDLKVDRTPEFLYTWLQGVESMLVKYNQDRPVPLYLSETGWPTNLNSVDARRPSVTEEGQSAFLARAFLLGASLPFLKGIWWFNLFDKTTLQGQKNFGSQGEPNFGLISMQSLKSERTIKPALNALRDIGNFIRHTQFLDRLKTSDDQVWLMRFSRPVDQQSWAVWSTDETQSRSLTFQGSPTDLQSLKIFKSGNTASINSTVNGNQISLNIGSQPLLIEGNLTKVTISNISKGTVLQPIQAPDRVDKKPSSSSSKRKKSTK